MGEIERERDGGGGEIEKERGDDLKVTLNKVEKVNTFKQLEKNH